MFTLHDIIQDYALMFVSAFGSATLLPFSSEVTLLYFLSKGHIAYHLLVIATLGNTLGAVVNWLLGRYFSHFESRTWFPFNAKALHRAQHWFQRYGFWSLLFAWLPLVGDALTCVAGVMRVRFTLFFVLVLIGKGLRYAVVIYPFI